ncbi:MAG: glycosyltransferase [Desulfobacterales bacterium]|nr:glycosyltransferase [Desulfobacterales bacterium]
MTKSNLNLSIAEMADPLHHIPETFTIGIFAPLAKPIPPLGYGGTEWVIFSLVRGLLELDIEGVELRIIIYASGDSTIIEHLPEELRSRIDLAKISPQGIWQMALNNEEKGRLSAHYYHKAVQKMREDALAGKIHVIHNHAPPLLKEVDLASLTEDFGIPIVNTFHTPIFKDQYERCKKYWNNPQFYFVSISDGQRKGDFLQFDRKTLPPPINWLSTVYNPVKMPPARVVTEDKQKNPKFKISPDEENPYFTFLGRCIEEKGPDLAIRMIQKINNKEDDKVGLKLIMPAIDLTNDFDQHNWDTVLGFIYIPDALKQINGLIDHIKGTTGDDELQHCWSQLDDIAANPDNRKDKRLLWIPGDNIGDKKYDIMAGSKGLLCPNQWVEPFGLMLVESFLSGTPVVVTRLGSVEEIVIDRKTGYILNLETQEKIVTEGAKAIKKLLSGKDEITRENCYQQGRRFSIEAAASGYFNAYVEAFQKLTEIFHNAGEMRKRIERVMSYLVHASDESETLGKINIEDQFKAEDETLEGILRNVNAAFLILLVGISHPFYEEAEQYLKKMLKHGTTDIEAAITFYTAGLDIIRNEIIELGTIDHEFADKLKRLDDWVSDPAHLTNTRETIRRIWEVFYPEGVPMLEEDSRNKAIAALRKKREVKITKPNQAPIQNPGRELLLTSNILLTTPLDDQHMASLSDPLKERARWIKENEQQQYYYDHPIPMGIRSEASEIKYGLSMLANAFRFERQRGTVGTEDELDVVLSVSVTHTGLHGLARDYIDGVINKTDTASLNIHVFTEDDTKYLINNILTPAAKRYLNDVNPDILHEIFGVDGKYGRHYNFLKAILAFWNVFVDSQKKGTFKIDLDQVFTQQELVEQSGMSAFEHFLTDRWGAQAEDNWGQEVTLGMIAGALVNVKDFWSHHQHLLSQPDVMLPKDFPVGLKEDELIFYSRGPQAASTIAEMIPSEAGQAENVARQRIHVTGGINGILLKHLMRYRPFTPTFIVRAEDQAYLLSTLFDGPPEKLPLLRYLHKDGLVMRHDKEAFVGEAIEAAKVGQWIADYERLLFFTFYARELSWSLERIKDAIDPFTGSFVSHIPFTITYVRMALKAAILFKEGSDSQGFELVRMGAQRLHQTIQELNDGDEMVRKTYERQRRAWHIYYDTLENIKQKLEEKDPFAQALLKHAQTLVQRTRVKNK